MHHTQLSLIHIFNDFGGANILITADHGFLYTYSPLTEDDKVDKTSFHDMSALGTGGMATKLSAAKLAIASGTDMVIANGQRPELLYDIAAGKPVGTRFIAKERII